MYNDLFSIGPLEFHTYGLMFAIGIMAACISVIYRAKHQGIDSSNMEMFIIWSVAGGFLGSKILYWLTQMKDIMQNPKIILDLTNGFVVYGGIIGGIGGAYLYCRRNQLPFLQYFDLGIPSVALAQGFGRIGCFAAGCCYGMETSGAFGIVFPYHSFAPGGVRLIPIQLISSGLDFILFGILIFFDRWKRRAHGGKSDGQVAALYLILYSMGRFVLEFFRGDIERGSVGILSTSQFISIFMFVIGCGMFLVCGNKLVRRSKR